MRGLVHVYCGDGKGKTTAAVGAAVRCAGCGGQVLYVSFLKDNSSGERRILENIKNIRVIKNPKEVKFFNLMTDDEKHKYTEFCLNILNFVEKEKSKYDMIILDECIGLINLVMVGEDAVIRLIDGNERPEIILTGREPSESIVKRADYVTEMKKIKHPYDRGISARKYIEM